MADSYKDILITPATDTANNPTLELRGANTSANVSFALQIRTSGANTLLVVQNTATDLMVVQSGETRANLTTVSINNVFDAQVYEGSGANLAYVLPTADDSSIGTDLVAWNKLKKEFDYGVRGGQLFAKETTRTYALVYTAGGYIGGVLAPNGDIHFVPFSAAVGQKISATGVVSTYSLVRTAASNSYVGGVLAPNGDIHFIRFNAPVGQKISASGVVSTYSLVYTGASYDGAVIAPNGDIHFVPYSAAVGQKIDAAGVVTTYTLVYTAASAYGGGALAPNGDIHFLPNSALVGQKISAAGVVSTYSLVYTGSGVNNYRGGVLSPNGDIHFVPFSAAVGQKISSDGVVSTYSLVYTVASAYQRGVLAPNGDIHFAPNAAVVGQKISSSGVVSTYSLVRTAPGCNGGVLAFDGSIHWVTGNIVNSNSGYSFSPALCLSPWLNKF